jgi:hypothetical protein
MNRQIRRRTAAHAGIPWRKAQIERLMRESAERSESLALRMSPEDAREALARWAAMPGRTQAEVDRLNQRAGASMVEESNSDGR